MITNFAKIKADILKYSKLPDNWNSYEANTPSILCILYSLKIINFIASLNWNELYDLNSAPTPDDSVWLEAKVVIDGVEKGRFSIDCFGDVDEQGYSCTLLYKGEFEILRGSSMDKTSFENFKNEVMTRISEKKL